MKQRDLVYLSDLSPKDKVWDKRRAASDGFKALYENTYYHCYAIRIAECSCYLEFAFAADDNGVCSLKLQTARFCRVRLCPVCQGRRALMWAAKTIKIMPKVLEANPKARFIMLTLTARNCPLPELKTTLSDMHKAWTKLVRRKDWKVEGWIRTTEVTRGNDDTAHPHYHCLLMVKPSYFTGDNYISQQRWVELWQDCLKVSYQPIVDVRAVHPKRGALEGQEGNSVIAALVEVIKYTVKPSDVLKGDNCQIPGQRVRVTDQDWLLQLTKQLHKTRAIATGGILKDYLKVLEDEPEDLIHADENGEVQSDTESPRVGFDWNGKSKRYHMHPEAIDQDSEQLLEVQ
jgi:plasmid rolling circle replication initiator protein Rep